MVFKCLKNGDDVMNNKEKIGVWNYDSFGFTRCSLCGWEHSIPGFTAIHCPSCGAYMIPAKGWDKFSREVVFNGDDVS